MHYPRGVVKKDLGGTGFLRHLRLVGVEKVQLMRSLDLAVAWLMRYERVLERHPRWESEKYEVRRHIPIRQERSAVCHGVVVGTGQINLQPSDRPSRWQLGELQEYVASISFFVLQKVRLVFAQVCIPLVSSATD